MKEEHTSEHPQLWGINCLVNLQPREKADHVQCSGTTIPHAPQATLPERATKGEAGGAPMQQAGEDNKDGKAPRHHNRLEED